MLSEKIGLTKSILISIQNMEKNENLKFLILLSVLLCLIVSPGAAASSNWEITPKNQVVGNIMEIKGTGFTGENAEVQVTFEKEVKVVDGNYEYQLEDVVIPSGISNRFTVQATGADDLNVGAKILLWITKTSKAKNGVATVSQTHVPPGTYNIRIDGKSNASSVKLKITATQKVEVDSTGSLTYKYDTKSIPAGNFELKIGSSTKQVELKPAEDLPSEITSSTEQNSSEEKRSDENSWNNLKFILSYPYSLRSFYTINESVKIIYKGPETLGQRSVDIYLVKERNTSYPENVNLSSMNESKISLEDVINNNTESYIQIPATLNEGGDLSPMTLGPLPAGNYWVLINLAGNKTETSESENKTLLAKSFEVLEYEMEAEAPYTVGEGKNFDINMSLKNALAQKNYTYWSVLIRKDAYTTEEGTNSSWMTAGTRPIVNGVDIIKILETNLTKYESEDGKEKLKEKIQTTIGKENGIVSIGEENQSNLSMKSLGLASGDYVLIAGANENDKGLVGIAQNKLKISAEKSYGLNLGSSLGNVTLGNVSSMKLKDSLFTGIESILNSKNIHF